MDDQNGDTIRDIAIGAAGATRNGRAGSGMVVVVAGQATQALRQLNTSPPLQTIYGPVAGAGLGASLAAAGNLGGDASVDLLAGAPGEANSAGAAYLVIGAAGTTSDLAQAAAKIAPAGAGAMTGSTLAAGLSVDGGGADSLVTAPGANGSGAWYLVGGSGTPVLPPPPATPNPPPPPPTPPAPPTPPPAPPAPPAVPPAPPATPPPAPPATTTGGTKTPSAPAGTVTTTPVTTTGTTTTATKTTAKPAVKKKKKKLPLCPLKKPKAKYKVVNGKRVKVKQAPCRARPKTKATSKSA